MSTSTFHEAARSDARDLTTRLLTTGMVRLDSAQATRRAVLHVQAAGDPAVPPDLTSWFTERGFQFYIAGVRLPVGALTDRHAERDLRPMFADLDAASACLRGLDGMVSVVVTARGRAAFAAALWCASRTSSGGRQADAVILSAPVWPARADVQLDIACPVLVVDGEVQARLGRLRPGRHALPGVPVTQLGRHVTWLALADADVNGPLYMTELGRWLGAYMYGPGRDRLL